MHSTYKRHIEAQEHKKHTHLTRYYSFCYLIEDIDLMPDRLDSFVPLLDIFPFFVFFFTLF